MDHFEEYYADELSEFGSDEEVDLGLDDEDPNPKLTENWWTCNFRPNLFEFNENPRVRIFVNEHSTSLTIFEHFFDENLMQLIVYETNKYQKQNKIGERNKMKSWYDASIAEMYCFFGIIILTGMIGKRRIRDYWSTDPLLHTPFFRQIFSRNRFYDLLRCIHFNDNRKNDKTRLYKIQPVVDVLRKKFRFCTYPTKNLCIDESLMLWKGRLIFKVYIPSKRNRFGIKFFLLVDCASKIVLDFIIYTGHESQIKMNNEVGISGSIVMTMMAPFLNKGHNLYVDNWYSSPNLFKLLYNNKTGACGTVRKNRTGMPKLERRLNQGEVENKCDGNMLALKWKDKREVHMLSTIHDSSMIKTRKRKRNGMFVYKPICVHDYSQNMGGVDKVDMQISFTESIRKTVKWSKKVFFHMLDLSIFNSYAIYKHKKTLELSFYEFKLDLVRNIF